MTNVNYLSDRIGLKWNAERWHMIIIILPVRDLQKTASLPLPLYPLLSSARPVFMSFRIFLRLRVNAQIS